MMVSLPSCSHYPSVNQPQHLKTYFGVEPPMDSGKIDMWPGYLGAFILRHEHYDAEDEAAPEHGALLSSYGLIPQWA